MAEPDIGPRMKNFVAFAAILAAILAVLGIPWGGYVWCDGKISDLIETRISKTGNMLGVWRDRNSSFSKAWARVSNNSERMKREFMNGKYKELSGKNSPSKEFRMAYETHVIEWVAKESLKDDMLYLIGYFSGVQECIENGNCDPYLAYYGEDSATEAAYYFFYNFRPYIVMSSQAIGNMRWVESIQKYGNRSKISPPGQDKIDEFRKTDLKIPSFCRFL